MIQKQNSNQENQLNQTDSYTISKNSPFYIDERYFEEIMVTLGLYISEKYKKGHEVGVEELLSNIAYIQDLTIHQKMSFALFFGKYIQDKQYEELILASMDTYS
jgi:hypothetical protein